MPDLFDTKFGQFLAALVGAQVSSGKWLEPTITLADSLLKWAGEKPGNYDLPLLGSGADAKVFWLRSDRKKALKITTDNEDARSCNILNKKPNKSLLTIHKVALLPGGFGYAILIEKLNPLSSSEEKKWENLIHGLRTLNLGFIHHGMSEDWLGDVKDEIALCEKDEIYTWEVDAIKEVLPTLETWVPLLTERGILWRDFHVGNIMMRRTTPIICDYGRSSVRGGSSIKKLPLTQSLKDF